MRNKKDIEKLEYETTKIFYKAGIVPPRIILPEIIFDWMDAEECFKIRIRTLFSKKILKKNYDINIDGKPITYKGEKSLIMIKDEEEQKKLKEVKKNIFERTGINIDKL